MSISSIASSLFSSQGVQVQAQPIFRTLQNSQSATTATPTDSVTLQSGLNGSKSTNPLSQDYSQLAQDLQSGNLSGAQQDFAKIQQDLRSQSQATPQAADGGHFHHHHLGKIGQLLQQVGQDLQSGDLTSAQQTFATLQQDLSQLNWAGGSSTQPVAANSVSVTA